MRDRSPGTGDIPAARSRNSRATPVSGASRRDFLKLLAVAGADAIVPASGSIAQITRPMPGRIDVHHHMIPPFYVKAMEAVRGAEASRNDALLTPTVSLEAMDKNGVSTSMLSVTQGVAGDSISDGSQRARTLARQNNEYGAQLVRDHPGRFGLFASLPLPDQDGSLREIEYSLDVLKADGICLWNVYPDKWPGDPAFAPVFDELNRRQAVIFFHPMRSPCCSNFAGQSGTIDFDIETARTIDSLLTSGTFARCRGIRFIFSHAGGAITVLWPRIIDDFPKKLADRVPNGVEYELKRLYFDTAKANRPSILDALKNLVPTSQILYGSDVPVRNYSLTNDGLEQYDGFSPNEWKAINRGNAERLFPRLKG